MKIILSSCLSIIIFALFTATSPAQKRDGNRVDNNYTAHFQEVITIHTDRNVYFAGETIWFRADYFLNEEIPGSDLSKIMYLQLYNDQGEIITEKKYAIEQSMAKGQLTIPEQASSGNCILMAYTKYQRNFHPLGFSHTSLVIVNPKSTIPGVDSLNQENIQIFPEGGTYLKGVENRLAIMIPTPLLEKASQIAVTENKDSIVQTLNPLPNGMVDIHMNPGNSTRHHLMISFPHRQTIWKAFPEPREEGALSTVEITGEKMIYSLVTGKGQEKEFIRGYKLEILSDDLHEVSSKPIAVANGHVRMSIPLESMNRGIHYFILRNPQGKVEKINPVYILKNNSQQIKIELNKNIFERRESVNAKLNTPFPLDSVTYSVSVVPRGTAFHEMKYLPSLFIHNPHLMPEYMEISDQELFQRQLKVAMILFHKRFIDKEFISNIDKYLKRGLKFYPEIRDLTLGGRLQEKASERPIPDIQMCFSVLDDNPQFHIYKTRENGEFLFQLNNLRETRNIFLYPLYQSEIKSEFDIVINRNFHSEAPGYMKSEVPIDTSDSNLLNNMYVNFQLSKTPGKSKQSGNAKRKASISPYFGHDKYTIHLKDYIELDNMGQVFTELVPHVNPIKKENDYMLKMLSERTHHRVLTENPLLFLDNMPVFDATKIMNLHPSQVETIEVINQPYILGEHAINGVILLTTNTGNLAGIEPPDNSIFAEYPTISKTKPFQTKKYPENINSREPDFRTLLYWNPRVIPTRNGSDISFYTSDRQGQYDIIVRGWKKGQLLYGRKTITVQGNP